MIFRFLFILFCFFTDWSWSVFAVSKQTRKVFIKKIYIYITVHKRLFNSFLFYSFFLKKFAFSISSHQNQFAWFAIQRFTMSFKSIGHNWKDYGLILVRWDITDLQELSLADFWNVLATHWFKDNIIKRMNTLYCQFREELLPL